ncbi:hypothetical protein B0H65DRAFT_92148 [Neurospora tetraspora]|uniref:Uncharacterized protein n=1 Tax=Neurospora tetraspora TaxID=94610 RepID=A0AAE0JJ53_9PEZI|nr:hypothetical protein B0H65DRAFT_92148 [Neurospora tetraspora]
MLPVSMTARQLEYWTCGQQTSRILDSVVSSRRDLRSEINASTVCSGTHLLSVCLFCSVLSILFKVPSSIASSPSSPSTDPLCSSNPCTINRDGISVCSRVCLYVTDGAMVRFIDGAAQTRKQLTIVTTHVVKYSAPAWHWFISRTGGLLIATTLCDRCDRTLVPLAYPSSRV